MLSIPGKPCKLCDGYSRREFLRVGGASLFGLSLPQFFSLQAQAAAHSPFDGSRGYGKAKSVILLFLQGGIFFFYGAAGTGVDPRLQREALRCRVIFSQRPG